MPGFPDLDSRAAEEDGDEEEDGVEDGVHYVKGLESPVELKIWLLL